VPPEKLGRRWALFAWRAWHLLSALDAGVLARVVPKRFFYNALITGTKPV
jgi:hypothetical protein